LRAYSVNEAAVFALFCVLLASAVLKRLLAASR